MITVQDQIIDLWENAKLTMTDIAKEIGTTRNVISGIIYRLRESGIKLSPRTNAPNPQRGKQKLRKAKLSVEDLRKLSRSRGYVRKKDIQSNIPKTYFEQDDFSPAVLTQSCGIMDLARNGCRFILNDPRDAAGARYCGNEIEVRSYCRRHYDLCYKPSKKG